MAQQNGRHAPPPIAEGKIDLGAHQRAVAGQIQADQQRLKELNEERERVIERINAGRGKLDLIAELAAEVTQAIPE